MCATTSARVDVMNALILAGADVNAADGNGETPLTTAACNSVSGYVDAIRALITAGANVNVRTEAGKAALMRASENGGIDAVRALIAAGADVNAKDGLSWTPLHFAVSRAPNPQVIRALLNAGADRRAKTDMGKTAFDLAGPNSEIKETDVYRLLKPDTP